MHVLIIFILILGLVLARMSSPMLNEGFDQMDNAGETGSTGDMGSTGDTGGIDHENPVPFLQQPLYSGVW